jgi:predicted nucleic acid-binding protein
MPKIAVVLDACVLFPMYLRDILLSTADEGLYLPYWSQKILNEAMRNLVSGGKLSQEKARNLEEVIKEAFPEAMVIVPLGLDELMTNDPKDRHVLAAAVTAKANVIVTNNLTDFKAKDLDRWNIKAQSPDDFLTELFDEHQDSIINFLQEQSKKYKNPPKTVFELLNFLGRKASLPQFAAICLQNLNEIE